MKLETIGPQVHRAKIDRAETKDLKLLMSSDWHWDNPKCDRDLLKRDLDRAKELGAYILVFGDLFCFMQGRYDPRRSKKDIRPEHNRSDYVDAVIEDCANWLEPYYQNLAFLSMGNHETSLLKNLETNPLQRLAGAINSRGGSVTVGNYGGWIWIQHAHRESARYSHKIHYHHGKWGGEVTKGVLATGRMAAVAPDADIVISGHTHTKWSLEIPRYRLRSGGIAEEDTQLHLKMGTYKNESLEMGGWFAERIYLPKNYKMWYVHFKFDTRGGTYGYYDTQTALVV